MPLYYRVLELNFDCTKDMKIAFLFSRFGFVAISGDCMLGS